MTGAVIDLGEDYRSPRDPDRPLRERLDTRPNRRALAMTFIVALLLTVSPPPPSASFFTSLGTMPDSIQAAPIIVDDQVYAVSRIKGGVGLRVTAYGLPDGVARWTSTFAGVDRISGARSSGDLVVFTAVGGDDERLLAVETASGQLIEDLPGVATIVGDRAVELGYLEDEGQPYLELTGRKLATTADTWTRRVPVPEFGFRHSLLSVPARQTVVVVDPGGLAYSVDTVTGALWATARVSAEGVRYATSVGGFAYFVSNDGELVRLEPLMLRESWRRAVPIGLAECGDIFCDDQDVNTEIIDQATGRTLFQRSLTWQRLLKVPGGWLVVTTDPAELGQVNSTTVAFVDDSGYGARPTGAWSYLGRDESGAAVLMRTNIEPPLTWFARLDGEGEIHVLGTVHAAVRNCHAAGRVIACSLHGVGMEIFVRRG